MSISPEAIKKSQADLLGRISSHMKDFNEVSAGDGTSLVQNLVNGFANLSRTMGQEISVACPKVDAELVYDWSQGGDSPQRKLEYSQFPEATLTDFFGQQNSKAFAGVNEWLNGLRRILTDYGIQYPQNRTAQWYRELGHAVEALRQVLFVRRKQLLSPLVEPKATGQGGALGALKPDIRGQLRESRRAWELLRDQAAGMDPEGERLGC
ncbi:MAG: hypothetical protein OXU45_07245 [Candidatus Melainabacteria bacterium]|nr:hypothetical protein [Candidatus Melainabacteria bacterium]